MENESVLEKLLFEILKIGILGTFFVFFFFIFTMTPQLDLHTNTCGLYLTYKEKKMKTYFCLK